jgi:acyl carrier protein
MDDIRRAVRSFVVAEFLQGEDSPELADDTPLRESGIIDSLGTVKLVSFVERTFGIEVDARDATPSNFGTLGAIAVYVARRRSGPRP